MREKHEAVNLDVEGFTRAFERAVAKAREESIRTGTPFVVWQDGRIVDLNAAASHENGAGVELEEGASPAPALPGINDSPSAQSSPQV